MEQETKIIEANDVKSSCVNSSVKSPQLRDHLNDDEILVIKNALDNIKSIEMYVVHDYMLYGNVTCFVSLITWLYSWLILCKCVEISYVSSVCCFIYMLGFYYLFTISKKRMKSLSDFHFIISKFFGEKNFADQVNQVEKEKKEKTQ